MKTSIRRHVCRQNHHTFLQCNQTDQVKEKGFARSVFSDNKADRCATLLDAFNITD